MRLRYEAGDAESLVRGVRNYQPGACFESYSGGEISSRETVCRMWEGYLVDTPGFSLLELPLMEPNELQVYYSDFEMYERLCRYNTCRHENEPGCAVVQAVEDKKISLARHARYCVLLKEAETKWRSRYD